MRLFRQLARSTRMLRPQPMAMNTMLLPRTMFMTNARMFASNFPTNVEGTVAEEEHEKAKVQC